MGGVGGRLISSLSLPLSLWAILVAIWKRREVLTPFTEIEVVKSIAYVANSFWYMYPISPNISDTISGIPDWVGILMRAFLDSVNLTVCLTTQSKEANNGH